jgi:hypothetical protein
MARYHMPVSDICPCRLSLIPKKRYVLNTVTIELVMEGIIYSLMFEVFEVLHLGELR